jgi:membrane dipeptidase
MMNLPSRRAVLQGAAFAGAPAVLCGRFPLFVPSHIEYSARAIQLMAETPVMDLLNQFRFPDYSEKPPRLERWLNQPESFTVADAVTYQESGIQVFALGAVAPDYLERLRFFAKWNGFLAARSHVLRRVTSVDDVARLRPEGHIGILLSMQDSTHFRGPDDVNEFFALGQRISQLTYNFNNRIGSGFLEQRDGGLSVFGFSILKRMEQVGMGVDLSHCGDQTTLDALEAAQKPVTRISRQGRRRRSSQTLDVVRAVSPYLGDGVAESTPWGDHPEGLLFRSLTRSYCSVLLRFLRSRSVRKVME